MTQISNAFRLPAVLAGTTQMRERLPFLRWRSELVTLVTAASPIVLIGLLNMAMSIADIVMLGRYDAEGLATVVVVSDLYSIIFNFSAGFAGVVTPHVAAALGARVRWHVCTIVRRTLMLTVGLGALGAGVIFFSAQILGAAGMQQSEAAAHYAACMAGTYVFMLLFALVRAVLSAIDRPGFAVLAIVAALPVKAALNYALIFGAWGAPELGVVGAGFASLLVAVLMGGSLTLHLLLSPSFGEFDNPEPLLQDLRELWQLARSGFLLGLIAVSETGVFLVSTIVIGLFAPQDLIVHALTFRSIAVCYLLVVGVGQAVTIRMAFLHARADRRREAHARRATAACGAALVAFVLMLLVVGAAPLAQLLASTVQADTDIAGAITALLRISGLALAAVIPAHIITAVLRAQHDVVLPTGVTMASYWGVALAVMLMLAGSGKGAQGVWFALLLGASISSASFAVYYKMRTRMRAQLA